MSVAANLVCIFIFYLQRGIVVHNVHGCHPHNRIPHMPPPFEPKQTTGRKQLPPCTSEYASRCQ